MNIKRTVDNDAQGHTFQRHARKNPLLLKEGRLRDQEMSRSIRTRADGVVDSNQWNNR